MSFEGVIQPHELAKRLTKDEKLTAPQGPLRIFDATVAFRRTADGMTAFPDRDAYAAGHIPGARFLDHQQDLSVQHAAFNYTLLPPDELVAAVAAIGIDDASTVVFYSTQHMMWATRAWWILRSCNFKKTFVLDGGFDSWQAAGLPVATATERPTSYPPGNFRGHFSPDFWADRTEVQAAIGSGDICTINALSAKSYSGESRVHYGRPGRIKDSVNVPYERIVEAGKLLSEEELRALFEEQGAFKKERVVTYCGGGIAATLAAFSLHQLGHKNVGVYDGSLSEWSADPQLPMETGGA